MVDFGDEDEFSFEYSEECSACRSCFPHDEEEHNELIIRHQNRAFAREKALYNWARVTEDSPQL